MKRLGPIWLLLFGTAYTAGYLLLTLLALGPEPKGGTPVFVPPIFTWPLILVGLFVLRNVENLSSKIFFILILICHYAITFSILPHFASGFAMSWSEIWRINSELIIFTTAWYLSGQSFMWLYFLYQVLGRSAALD